MKKQSIVIVLMAFVTVGSVIYGHQMSNNSRTYKVFLENQYERNLYDLITNTKELEVSLSKVLITASRPQSLLMFGDIWRQASYAQDKINSLPIANEGISNIVKFFSQVSDFSYAMLKSNKNGSELSKSDFANLEKLKDYCGYITLQLNEFVGKVGETGISFDELRKNGSNYFKDTKSNINLAFKNLSQEIQQYPTLIYDGPFSENVLNIKPRVLEEKEISIDTAKKLIMGIYGEDKVGDIKLYSDKKGQKIPAYSFSVKLKARSTADISIDISKNGGHILYLLDARNTAEEKVGLKAASEIGMKFLNKMNYPYMLPLYTLKYDGIAIINYVGIKNKTLIYPDQIKLKVALDNGDIVGIESQSYLIAHHNRDLAKSRISVQEAKNKINKKLIVKNIRLTLIPMQALREVLCYEFYCEFKGERYFVYINAMNGAEEKILKVINTSNGELTM